MPSNNICSSCSSRDNCNIDIVRRDEICLVCNSAIDKRCSQLPSKMMPEQCEAPSNGQCYSRIQNGATIRGCVGSLDTPNECNNSTESSALPAMQCYINSGPGSNKQVIPSSRLKCYHCDSRIDATCTDTPTKSTPPLPCSMFVQQEHCLKLVLKDDSSEC